jgi:pimeloyl-ACP methyl ester carboxylesterase
MAKSMTTSDSQPEKSGFQQINGHRIYWEQYGPSAAENIILLHHGLGSIRSWKRQVPALISEGYRVFLYDRWGYGRSDPRQEFELRFLHKDAQETIALMQSLGIENACFLGHSDGGSIALIIANRNPSFVRKLIVVAAHIYVEPKMAKGLIKIQRASKLHPLKTVLEQEHGARHQALVKAWLNCWGEHGLDTLDLKDELKGVRCPTLVIQGEKDEHATPKHAEDIAQGISDAELWIVPGVGHMPPHEVPEEFNQRIIQFLHTNDPLQDPFKKTGHEMKHVQ